MWDAAADLSFLSVTPSSHTGPGKLRVTADCKGLPKGQRLIGHVGVEAHGGQFKLIEVRLHT